LSVLPEIVVIAPDGSDTCTLTNAPATAVPLLDTRVVLFTLVPLVESVYAALSVDALTVSAPLTAMAIVPAADPIDVGAPAFVAVAVIG